MTSAIAKRYARALASVAGEQNRLEDTATELETIAGWLDDADVKAAFESPHLSIPARRGLVARLAESQGLSELARNFLSLLAERNRLDQFRAIVLAYQALVDRSLGRVRATIRAATPLDDASTAQIRDVLEQLSGKKVLVSVVVDPTLIAGVSVEIEGRVYDGSAHTQLAHLARSMAREVSPA
ncbi:ATP synthase F1 subunit delta [Candidatus Binatia bacterium]|nr:ATP synthase F1 subunit delta [Candidatus Binatia bacterium]